jgi:chromosome segregation ATPase
VVKGLQRELENEQLRSGRIMQEIERLRNEINDRFLKKEEFEFNLNRFELRLVENNPNKKEYTRELNEMKDKTAQEIRNIC